MDRSEWSTLAGAAVANCLALAVAFGAHVTQQQQLAIEGALISIVALAAALHVKRGQQ